MSDAQPRRRGLDVLNSLPADEAERELLRCCGSRAWAREMIMRRPFRSRSKLADIAQGIWSGLDRESWLEAFAAHPRIGETATKSHGDARWSEGEQSGVNAAGAATQNELQRLNTDYEARFGHIFIVCASGLSRAQVLERLRARMKNKPEDELEIAAGEQAKITTLRLEKLLTELRERK